LDTNVEITTRDGTADAYVSRPDDEPRPGVLFVIDAYGLRPTIETMADRIAGFGYVVLAPNVLYRGGGPDELTPERLADDGAVYLDTLQSLALPGPVAITGYCMGGRIGWRIAAGHPDRVAALAAFHPGRLVTDAPDSPHRSAADLKAELYFGFADQDPSMSAEQIATLERTLDDVGARYRAEIYPGARHGYTMADTAAYDEAAAQRHYQELRALLSRTFGTER
jgi:carboxymethylenebutenolidase